MRLKEYLLQEGSFNTYTGPRNNGGQKGYGSFRDYPEDEIEDVIKKVMRSDEYLELTKHVPLVSTTVELKHGLLSFEIEKDNLYWDINLQGNVRYKSKAEGMFTRDKKFITGLLKAAHVNMDASPVARYIANIKELLEKLKRKNSRDEKSFEAKKGDDFESFSEIGLWDDKDYNSVIINDQNMEDLVGCPSKLGTLSVQRNKTVLSLEGCPKIITNKLDLSFTKFTNIELLPQRVGKILNLAGCDLTNLSGIGKKYIKSCPEISIYNNPIVSSILGLVLVDRLKDVINSRTGEGAIDRSTALNIIMTHVKSGNKDLMDCKEELMINGLKEYAKL